MFKPLRKILPVLMALVLALLGSGVLQPAIQAQAASVQPGMSVTLMSRGSTYTTTIDFGAQFTFQAKVQNTGNVPLQMIANLDVPQGWDVNQKYNNCPESLTMGGNCTFTWVFTPHVSGTNYLRVYLRGLYTDASGNGSRITQAPAFLLKVRSAAQTVSQASSSASAASTSSTTTVNKNIYPRMNVTLIANNLYTYAATIYAAKPLIFRARVQNTGNVPLQVVANLNVPKGWEVDQDKFSDCPAKLAVNATCTVSWYFTPQASGQVILRVYARGIYTTSSGDTNRITQSPAFIFNVKPPKS
jgi:hypothetical protein